MHASEWKYGSPIRSRRVDTQHVRVRPRRRRSAQIGWHTASVIQMLLIALVTVTPAFGQGGRGCHGMMGDGAHAADMQVFHQLFEHRTEITRQVHTRADGVETVTESKNPEVTRLLQTHVAAMLARVKEGRPIHQRDPLFVELFKNADRIEARHELTAGGSTGGRDHEGRVNVVKLLHRACGGGQRISREWYVGDDEEPSGSAAPAGNDVAASSNADRRSRISEEIHCRSDMYPS